MKRILTALTLLLSMQSGVAQGGVINRCLRADGILEYTDRSCQLPSAVARLPAPHVWRPALVQAGCTARSPEALRLAVNDAIDRRDFNALAGLYNFDGRSRASAAPVIRRLQRMAKQTSVEIALIERESESLFDVLISDPAQMPVMRVVQRTPGGVGPPSIETFDITQTAGCVWLAR